MENIMEKYQDALRNFRFDNDLKFQRDNFRSMHAHVCFVMNEGVKYELFYSYETLVAAYVEGYFFFSSVTYSTTTSKQITAWCEICTADRRKGIKSGLYGSF